MEDRNIVGILIPDEQQYEYPALINDIRVALFTGSTISARSGLFKRN